MYVLYTHTHTHTRERSMDEILFGNRVFTDTIKLK